MLYFIPNTKQEYLMYYYCTIQSALTHHSVLKNLIKIKGFTFISEALLFEGFFRLKKTNINNKA